jgi:hypothetical protein
VLFLGQWFVFYYLHILIIKNKAMSNFFIRVFKVIYTSCCCLQAIIMVFALMRFRENVNIVQAIYALILAVCSLGLLVAAMYAIEYSKKKGKGPKFYSDVMEGQGWGQKKRG